MSILVTGATGRVGSRLVPRLLDQGERVRILVRDADRVADLAARGADVLVGDLRDPERVERALDGVEAVVHVAATFRSAPEEKIWAVNHTAAVDLATATISAPVPRFVFISTNLVYGSGRGRPLREDDEFRPAQSFPAGAYPESKAAAETELFELHRTQGLGLRTLRLSFVYGYGDPHLAESPRFARAMAAHQRMAMVHHADVAQAVLRALRTSGIDGRAYNVTDDAPMTAYELLAFNGEDLPDGAAERALDDPWQGIPDTTRIRAELGFRPIYPTVYAARDAGAL